MFFGISGSGDWISAERVEKGWSKDEKYLVTARGGERLLLRLADASAYEAKKKEFEIVSKFARIGFPMSRPVDFGMCEGGEKAYMLLTWVDGEELSQALPGLGKDRQYALGREAGAILKAIHSLPLDEADRPVATKREKKMLQLRAYEASSVRVPGDEDVVRYVKENIGRIWTKDPAYQHGDFHPGNLIFRPDGSIGVIDFNRWEVGDPYEEFYKLESFGRELSVPYCVGQIDGYFGGRPPREFWEALAVYVAHASLVSIKWAEKFSEEDVRGMVRRCMEAFDDFGGFLKAVPKWYGPAVGKGPLTARRRKDGRGGI